MGKVIGIMSFKGGVGKTTTTINLACALHRHGKTVLVIDGNFLSPNLHLYLGLLNPEKTLKEVLRDGIDPVNAIYEHRSGIHAIPCSFYKDLNFEKFHLVVRALAKQYDYVLIDSGPSYTEEVIAILIVSDEIFFVTTPDYPSVASTIKATKLARYKGVKLGGIIINRKKRKRFELKPREITNTVGVDIAAEIPEDIKMQKALPTFMPAVAKYPRSKASKEFIRLAKAILSPKRP